MVKLAVSVCLALLLGSHTACAANVVYVVRSDKTTVNTPPGRAALSGLLSLLAPRASLEELSGVACWQADNVTPLVLELQGWHCMADLFHTHGDEALLDEILSHKIHKAAPNTVSLVIQRASHPGSVARVGDVAMILFGLPLDQVARFACAREQGKELACLYNRIKTASGAQWLEDYDAGRVVGTIGRIK